MPADAEEGIEVPDPARILVVHERYREPGGEDIVFEQEARLLEAAGHQVERLVVDNAEIPAAASIGDRLALAAATVWSRSGARLVAGAVRRHRPQVVHFHNTFPLLSPSAFGPARRGGAAVVQTLHNYRLLCPSANLLRDGAVCEDCVGRTAPWPGVLHACYRGSRSQSAAVAVMLAVHNVRRTWRREVDLFLAPSESTKGRLVAGGLSAGQISVKPNFVDPDPGLPELDLPRGEHFLFVGRLVLDKGIPTLLEAWSLLPDGVRCRIVGAGPLDDRVAAAPAIGIEPVGRLDRDGVVRELRAARALVFPSVWHETFGLTIVEAFACGLPVIASRLGAVLDLVDEGRTGLLVTPGDAGDLARAVGWAVDHPAEMARMGQEARREYELRYTAAAGYPALIGAYRRAIELRRRTSAARGGSA